MTELRTILFATDLSPESDTAFEHARFLAERFEARLTIYHGLELPRTEYAGWIDPADDRLGRWERRVREQLSARAAIVKVPHEILVEGPLPGGHFLVDLALLEVIHKTRPDLTVMATRGRTGFASFFLGSVTEQVAQHARRPVLCVRKSGHGVVLPYERILVPTDLSLASRRAFPLAALLARKLGATVVALHVLRPPTVAALVGVPGAAAVAVTGEGELRRFLQPDFDGVAVEAHVYPAGAPWDRIVTSAAGEKADLVVMATQGHDSVRDGIIGSNAERVLRHAPCPVLVA
jgi:nucleotide-binding universal stress UspA family protein